MAQHGSRAKVFLDALNLTRYLKSFSWERSTDPPDSTALGDDAHKFIPGLEDASASGEGMYDSDSGPALDTRTNQPSVLSYYPSGDAAGALGQGASGIPTSLAIESPVDGITTLNIETQASGGSERLVSIAPLASRTGTANVASHDGGASSATGWAAYLHATSVPEGETLDVKLQDSADNSTFADVATFAEVDEDGGAERVAGAGTLRRYVRASHVVSDGNATYQVGVCRTPNE
ncbi:MAG TPA: hypothetical protein VEW67_04005 [Thermoleophilaceae bacterium]|nr:hypothetical protein [Thermoleophilaceae bacterium]